MAKNQYVRLSAAAQHGIQVDINSGWGISGRDVRQIPSDPAIQDWIKDRIRKGIFEEASKAEWDEVHELDDELDDTPMVITVPLGTQTRSERSLRRARRERGASFEAKQHVREHGEPATFGGSDSGDDEDEDGIDDAVSGLKVEELKNELEARDLPTSGKKSELQARLRNALEADGEGDGS